jgi:hypothetical protein
MNEIGVLEIIGRRKWFSNNWDADNFSIRKTKETYSLAMCEKLELVLLAELDGNVELVNSAFDFIKRARANMLNAPESIDYWGSLDLLVVALFFGNDSDFQMFVDEMQKIEAYEKSYRSIQNYFYYKCLCAVWRGDLSRAREILDNNQHEKGKRKFYLPSSPDAVKALLNADEDSFIQFIEKMRSEYSRKHRNVNVELQSTVRKVADMATLALLKVAQKQFTDITQKLPERIDTFKFVPCFIDGIDLKERGVWSIDHLFPIKYWPND